MTIVLLVTASVSLPFDPGQFVHGVNHPLFPLVPGTTFAYRSRTHEGTETDTVEVTHDTRTIAGVSATVVHDREYLDGVLTEDTFDWYAQDRAGNVWYLGEDSKTIEHGVVVSTAGSWEAGKNGAKAGIVMLAQPKVGASYRQENHRGVAEDMGEVVSLKEAVQVPYGHFTSCLKTAEWTSLEPGHREFKYYMKGVGLVLEVENQGKERVELVSVTKTP